MTIIKVIKKNKLRIMREMKYRKITTIKRVEWKLFKIIKGMEKKRVEWKLFKIIKGTEKKRKMKESVVIKYKKKNLRTMREM